MTEYFLSIFQVICEEPATVAAPPPPMPEIDLKCKEKVTDSDSECLSDIESHFENKTFPQQRFSPVSGVKSNNSAEITCRPKPIKARYRSLL